MNAQQKTIFIKNVRKRLDYYLSIVVKNLKDSIPKVVGQILVQKTQDMLQLELIDGVTKHTEVLECQKEPEHIRIERETVTKAVNVLRKAQKKLGKEGLIKKDDDEEDYDY